MAVYLISWQIINSNTRSSHLWRVNAELGIVAPSDIGLLDETASATEEDVMMSILARPLHVDSSGFWVLDTDNYHCANCNVKSLPPNSHHDNEASEATVTSILASGVAKAEKNIPSKKAEKTVDCTPYVNVTKFDSLMGVANRKQHPPSSEPDIALMFKRKTVKSSDVDLVQLEKKLRKAKKDKPKSVDVYNQIGNFWRIKGSTHKSIECFRKALYLQPDHPDVLLNLARVLFHLQYLDDAKYLILRSLEKQSPEQNWLQHFTLGEILKAYGHEQEARIHFHHALELNPSFFPAEEHLRKMEVMPEATITIYTLLIIAFLVMAVLLGLLSSIEGGVDYGEILKTQRHFNRAMAMRSIKLGGTGQRQTRMKKYNS